MDGKIRFKRVLSCFLSAVLLLTGSAWLVLAEQGQPSEYTSEAAGGEQPDETAASSVDGTIASSGEINAAPSEEAADVELAEWSWSDPEGVLQENEGSWMLGLPGVSQSNPLTGEALLALLPEQIEAVTSEGETLALAIAWDVSSIPEEGVWSGIQTYQASLPEGYALAESAGALEVTVELGGAETYAELPSGTPPFQNHIVEGVSPKGTTINLFDYWLTDRTAADNGDPAWVSGVLTNDRGQTSRGNVPTLQNYGINAGHALLFGSSLSQGSDDFNDAGHYGLWNTWTHSAQPRSDVVGSTLSEDGYPVLDLTQSEVNGARYTNNGYYYSTLTGRDPQESLAYLFDPQDGQEGNGKKSYSDVQGLLQVDQDGYYYYDSAENYAAYYADTNSFVLYDTEAVKSGGAAGNTGQFFPFNAADDVLREQGGTLSPNGTLSNSESLNHYFGIAMTTQVVHQYGGHTDEERNQEVTYEFSGDDDVWVFIDDVLVADLGGIHDASSLSINFATGRVDIFDDRNDDGKYNGNDELYESNTLRDAYSEAGALGETSWDGSTYADNTYHTLKFFYLERGNVDSNMSLKFNLATVPESGIIKVDQAGNHIAGAEFSLYSANEDYEVKNDTPICSGVTDADGELTFVDSNGVLVSLERLYSEGHRYLVLRETKTPDGYRSAGDMHLYFHRSDGGDVVLLSGNPWDTGSYASAKVTVQTGAAIKLANGESRDLTEGGTLFAVVLQRQDMNGAITAPNNWKAVSGDPEEGWYVSENGNTLEGIIEAAQANPYKFGITASGSFEANVDNLPGDIKAYYYMLADQSKEDAEYTIGYYYTSASSVNGATPDNTQRVDSDDFLRIFSVDLYVANISNNLYVQKLNEQGEPVFVEIGGAAEFALYRKEDVTINGDGTYTLADGASAYMTAATQDMTYPMILMGGAMFTAIEEGAYYLIETKAPPGYEAEEAAVPVIVDGTGVYADAGTQDDAVTVRRGVGSVVRSMLQFAADDDIDTTLHDIIAELVAGSLQNDQTLAWGDWDADASNDLHLQYRNDNEVLEYGAKDENGNAYFDVDAGWSKLLIRQCLDSDHQGDEGISSNKQDLGDTDLTNLFSGTVTVRIRNQSVGNLRISKTVTGEDAPADDEFTFTLALTGEGGASLEGAYAGTVYNSDGTAAGATVVVNGGSAEFTLKGGQWVLFENLPAGAGYTVTETNVPAGYTSTVTVDGTQSEGRIGSGSIPHNDTSEAAFVNVYDRSVTLSGDTALKGRKTLVGRNITGDDAFAFTLVPDADTAAAIERGEIVTAENYGHAAVEGDGSANTAGFTFGDITFKKPGTYRFSVGETLPAGVTADSPVSGGVRYDTHVAAVSVEVAPNSATGLLEARVTYDNTGAPSGTDAGETGLAAFTNYVAAGFSFYKVTADDEGLGGATFALYRLDCGDAGHGHGEEEIPVTEDGVLPDDYQYKDCWELVGTAVSAQDTGLVQFSAVPVAEENSEYRLVEIGVPGGYTAPDGQWKLEYRDGSLQPKGAGDASVGNPPAIEAGGEGQSVTYRIRNYRPGELPFSGNSGIRQILIIGGALMACGAAGGFGWCMYRRKKATAVYRKKNHR